MENTFNDSIQQFLQANISLPDQWWDDKKAEFIYNSNKLEGNLLQLVDTHSIIKDRMHFVNEVRFKDVLEVKGHVKALDTCVFMAKNKYPLTENTLKQLNENLLSALWKFEEYYTNWKLSGQVLGNYKAINNSIKYFLDGKEGVIEPFSNTETVVSNMALVLNETKKIPSVLERCAHLAYQLWVNQPFPDANKRTARLVVAYYLMQEGLPLITFKAEGVHFNEGLLRSHFEKSLSPLMTIIQTEVKHQISEIMELNERLKKNKKPPNLGLGSSLIF